MPGGLNVITQDDFSGGMFQAPDTQRIPANGSYDIVNGLLDADEGVVYRRGGGTYLSPALSVAPFRIWSAFLAGGVRTLYGTAAGGTGSGLWVLAADDQSSIEVIPSVPIDSDPGVGQGIAWFPANAGTTPTVYGYGGYRGIAAPYLNGSVALTTGSVVVTGTGTVWSTNVQPGYILRMSALGRAVAVQSVDSDTQITLTTPWDGNTLTGQAYTASPTAVIAIANFAGRTGTPYATVAGNKLLVGLGGQVVFSASLSGTVALSSITTNFHQLPSGAQVLGLRAIRDTALVFTDKGVYTISNVSLDLTDAAGNPQQRLDQVSADVVVLNGHGVAGWKSTMVVPAIDDVYLLDGVSAPVSIGGPIRSYYRSLIRAGWTCGQAAVYNGQYVLPIVSPTSTGDTPVTTLVCNLNSGAWTECVQYSANGTSYVRRPGSTTRQPQLLSFLGSRITDCSGWWVPTASNKNDVGGAPHTFTLTTRDYSTSNVSAFFKKLRVWIEGVDAGADNPTLTAKVAEGIAGSSFTSLTGTVGASSGDTPAGKWDVNTGGRRVRFQISSTSPWASLKIKALDIFVRPKGRA